MRRWETEPVVILANELDAKQQQVERLAEAMLSLANDVEAYQNRLSAERVAEAIRETVKEVLEA